LESIVIYLFTCLAILGTIVSFAFPTLADSPTTDAHSGIEIKLPIKVKKTYNHSRKVKHRTTSTQSISVTGSNGARGKDGISQGGASVGGNGGNSGNTGNVSGFSSAGGGKGSKSGTGGSAVTIGVSGNSAPGGAGATGNGRNGGNVSGGNGTPGSQIEISTQEETQSVDSPQ
jgi:hypothetical protein